MEDLSKYTHLHKRNGQYYFRIRVPDHLVVALKKKEIKVSLRTKDLKEAKHKLPLEVMKANQLFEETELRLKPALSQGTPIQTAPDSALYIPESDLVDIVIAWFQEEREAIQNKLRGEVLFNKANKDDLITELQEEIAALSSPEASTPSIQRFAKELFKKHQIDLKELTTDQRRFIYREAQIALFELANFKLSEVDKSHHHAPLKRFHNPRTINHSLGKTIELFKKSKMSDGITDKSLVSYNLLIKFLLEFFGKDKPINTISSSDCREMRNALIKLPANAHKKFPNLSLMKIIESAPKHNAPPLSATSVNSHMQRLSAIFNFAMGEQMTDHNPAKTIKSIKQKDGKRRKPRMPFTEEEFRTIFTAPLFTGCKDDERGYAVKGNNRPKRHRYWVPLIAYFTGMRLNEICQLFHEDIIKIDGIYCINVEASTEDDDSFEDEEGKSLKTAQSNRTIPIPEQLIRLGFIDFVESAKKSNKGKRLFAALTISARGSPSDNFSKWFGNFLESVGITAKGKCFHSFRHNFRDRCRNARIDPEIAGALGGWQHSDNVMDQYGIGHDLSLKHEAINKLSPLPADIEELIK